MARRVTPQKELCLGHARKRALQCKRTLFDRDSNRKSARISVRGPSILFSYDDLASVVSEPPHVGAESRCRKWSSLSDPSSS